MKKSKRRKRTFISTNASAKINVPKRPQSPLVAALSQAGNSSQPYGVQFDAGNRIPNVAKVKHEKAIPSWVSRVENLMDYNLPFAIRSALRPLLLEIMQAWQLGNQSNYYLILIHEDFERINSSLERMALFVEQKDRNQQPAKSRDAHKWLRNLISRMQDVFGKSGATRPGDNDDE